MLLSRHQNAGQNHDETIGKRCFENVAQFRYLGTTITDQNLIQKGIKRWLNSGNACYHSVQNPLSSRLLSKNIKIRIYKTIIIISYQWNLGPVLYEPVTMTTTYETKLHKIKRIIKGNTSGYFMQADWVWEISPLKHTKFIKLMI
jgi:hypothetical protein